MLAKPFGHPAIVAILRECFFASVRGGCLASKYSDRFSSSLPNRPTELEIPCAMLALVGTAVGLLPNHISAWIYFFQLDPRSSRRLWYRSLQED